MQPIASPLSANTLVGLAPMVNNVAIKLGLQPFQGGEIRLDDDYGVIAQRLVQVITGTLARGWWFNTKYRTRLTSEQYFTDFVIPGTSTLAPPGYILPYLVISWAIPRFGEGQQPASIQTNFNNDRDLTIISVLDEGWDYDANTLEIDLITSPIGADYANLPAQFTEYVVAKTSEELAPYFGAAVNPEDTARTWHELVRAQADYRPPYNMIEDNPINWLTTRRR